jgi:hypothetical protein
VKSSSFAPAAKADDQREPQAGTALRVTRFNAAGDPDVRLRSPHFNARDAVKVADLSYACDQSSGVHLRVPISTLPRGSRLHRCECDIRNTELAEVAPYADVGESSFINGNNLL